MEELWDRTWIPHQKKLLELDLLQKLRFNAACVDRAVWRLQGDVSGSVYKVHLPLILRAVNVLWKVSQYEQLSPALQAELDEVYQKLEPLAPNVDHPGLIFGWEQLLDSLLYALSAAYGHTKEYTCLTVADAAYRVVWFQQIYPHTNRPLDMERMNRLTDQLQRKNAACQADLAFQLECVERLQKGEDVERTLTA